MSSSNEYNYFKELNFNGEIKPVGHYNISTWSSETDSASHVFKITKDTADLTKSCKGIMFITCASESKSCIVNIPVDVTKSSGSYTVSEDEDLLVRIQMSSNVTKNDTVYKIDCSEACSCSVILQGATSCNIKSVNTVVSNLDTLHKKVPLLMLREGIDYGDDLPESGTKGRLFFVKL